MKRNQKATSFSEHRLAMALIAVLVFGGSFAAFYMAGLGKLAVEDGPLDAKRDAGSTHHLAPVNVSVIAEKVLPASGFVSKIRWGDAIPKLVGLGVINKTRFARSVSLTPAELAVLDAPSDERIRINENTSWFTVTVLWPLGIANKNPILEKNGMAGPDVDYYASTGGWTLGNKEGGGAYYNKYELITLTPEQQELAEYVADRVFRPCCNNPTSFPDCNHGAAMLALIELGASQGLTKEELFEEALHFNSFWFPQTYLETAIYFEAAKGISWEQVSSEEIVGKDYSSGSGSIATSRALQKMNITLSGGGGGSCSA